MVYLGHVTGINSATTICQQRAANHDLYILLKTAQLGLAFELNKNIYFMLQNLWKAKD